MTEWDIMKRLDRVKAPPDFEQKVMAQLAFRKRAERRRRAVLRWSMAGSFASLAAVAILLNVLVFQGRTPPGVAGRGKDVASASSLIQKAAAEQTIRIIETLDYRSEMRSRSTEPETVYLLEQVSDTTPRGIKY
jgi:hypothetical protein